MFDKKTLKTKAFDTDKYRYFKPKVQIAIGITFVYDCFKNKNNAVFGVYLQKKITLFF